MQTRADASRSIDRDDLPGLVASVILVDALGAAPALLVPYLLWATFAAGLDCAILAANG